MKIKKPQILWLVKFTCNSGIGFIRTSRTLHITTEQPGVIVASHKAERVLAKRKDEFEKAQIVSIENLGTIADE